MNSNTANVQAIDLNQLNAWLGKYEDSEDLLSPTPVRALAAALGYTYWQAPLPSLPALRHWLYFPILITQANTALDGHAKKGGFLPPVPLPRRMWAGSDVSFNADLNMGRAVYKRSTIKSITLKQGSTGPLVFVDVEHALANDSLQQAIDAPAVVDLHHIVYREAAGATPQVTSAAPAAPMPMPASDWCDIVVPDEVMLFRYSALTYNSHRIHYDLPYVTQVEGYAGLVTHGPLQATLMLDACLRANQGKRLKRFSFKAMAPSFSGDALSLAGKMTSPQQAEVWLARHDGSIGLKGSVSFE